MRVTHRRVSQQYALLTQHPLCKPLGPELFELLPASWRGRRLQRNGGQARQTELCGPRPALRFDISIDDRFANEFEYAGCAVPLAWPVKQLWRRINEPGGVLALRKRRMCNELVEEAQVGNDTSNPEFPQRAMHTRN